MSILFCILIATAAPEGASSLSKNDLVCGPRCVQYILKEYGQQGDLIELIREMQWPNLEGGSTLTALEQALTSRGIHCGISEVPEDAQIAWKHPVIVHLRGRSGTIGHFAIWLPCSSNETVWLWAGPHGFVTATLSDFARERTPLILLTSTDVIAHDANSYVQHHVTFWLSLSVAVAAFTFQ